MTNPSVMAVRAARAMREVPDLTDAVTELAQLRGWQVHHGRPAQTAKGWRTAVQGDVGFPDVVLAHRSAPVTIVAELKRYGLGRHSEPTPEQQAWLDLLGRSPGVLAVCWTTLDWVLGDIDRALREREWWIWRTTARVGHLRVALTQAEAGQVPAGLAVADAGESGPERPRSRR